MLNDGLQMQRSYYAATASQFSPRPVLLGAMEADVVVVGAGCTGLSAALHASERGLSVIVLEGGRVGWGASGRNGGQMIPGLRKGAVELVRTLGKDRAKALFDLSLDARSLVLDLIDRHKIACDLKTTGHLIGAVRQKDLQEMSREVSTLEHELGYPHCALLTAGEVRREVETPYCGGLLDRLGGHLHPLNYTLGLAQAAERAGVAVFESSGVVTLTQADGRVRLATDQGYVVARRAVLAGDALLTGLEPAVDSRIMPVANYLVATEPLEDPSALIANDLAVSDSRFVVNYYRLTADGRLLFGGGERYTPQPPTDMTAFVRPFLQKTFPQLKDRSIDYAWGGLVSVTRSRLPHIGRRGAVYFAHGYSGQGVLLSCLAGKLLVAAMSGEMEGFDLFASLEPPAFPGGIALRTPLYVLGMLWYALRDRL